MTDDPVNLDERRGNSARKATEVRRQRLDARQAQQVAQQRRQDELEKLFLTGPAKTRPEAIARARYLLQLFATTTEGQKSRQRDFIALALEDFARLWEDEKDLS